MVNMRIKIICFLMFLLFLVAGSELFAQSSTYVCPVEEGTATIEAPNSHGEGETVTSSKAYKVPRKQVLLEIATRTT